MKKILGLLLVAAFALPAHATFIKNVKVVGEVQTIGSDVKNADVDLPYSYRYTRGTKMRVMAGLSFDIVEKVTANVLFQYSHMWGEDGKEGRTVRDYWDNSYLAEANVVLHDVFDNFELTVGRQFYGDEDSAVMYIGPRHYNAELSGYDHDIIYPLYGRRMWLAPSMDAAKLTYANDWLSATFVGGKLPQLDEFAWAYHTTYTSEPVLLGSDIKMELVKDFTAQLYGYYWGKNIYYYTDNIHGKWNKDRHVGFYGAKLKYAPEHFLISGEYARNFSGDRLFKEHNGTGHMGKVDVAVKPVDEFTLRGTFYYVTYDFLSFGNYAPGLLTGNLLQDRLNRYAHKGIRLYNVGLDIKPTHKWTVSLDGYALQSAHADHQAALEADLTVKYAHNEYIELFAGVGYVRYSQHEPEQSQSWFNLLNDPSENLKSQIGMLVRF